MKKKLTKKQKEITVLKERNKKLADDLAEEESKHVQNNPNNLILTNLLKSRTMEMKKIEKEKESLKKSLSESNSKLKEASDRVTKAETKSIRLETEVDNLIEILGKKDQVPKGGNATEVNEEEVQVFQPDGSSKRCSFNNKAMCRNNTCRFVHSDVVCKSYSLSGKCDQGIQCPGRHPTGVCNRWKYGNCQLKIEVCQFRHHEDSPDGNGERESKRKRSLESTTTGRAKSSRGENINENSRNDFLCEQINVLHRKIDSYERKEKGEGWKEEEKITLQQTYNAPPVPPFTTYLPVQNFSHSNMSMVQSAGPTTTTSFQPAGRMSTPNPSPIYTNNTAVWGPPQAQWAGQARPMPGPAQSQPPHLQEAHQLPYPVGQAFNQFYQ